MLEYLKIMRLSRYVNLWASYILQEVTVFFFFVENYIIVLYNGKGLFVRWELVYMLVLEEFQSLKFRDCF
jgi:hypothetical protein